MTHLIFRYTNWQGKVAMRTVTPRGVRFGRTARDKDPEWLLVAWDHDKGAEREFALADCEFGVKE